MVQVIYTASHFLCVGVLGGGGGLIRLRGVRLGSCLLSFDTDSRIYELILSLVSSACPSHLCAGQSMFVRVCLSDWSSEPPLPTRVGAPSYVCASGSLLSWPFTSVWLFPSKVDICPSAPVGCPLLISPLPHPSVTHFTGCDWLLLSLYLSSFWLVQF